MVDVVIENNGGLLLCHKMQDESRLMVDCRNDENRVVLVIDKNDAKKLRDYIDAWLRIKE